jgi:hypothetical protein
MWLKSRYKTDIADMSCAAACGCISNFSTISGPSTHVCWCNAREDGAVS